MRPLSVVLVATVLLAACTAGRDGERATVPAPPDRGPTAMEKDRDPLDVALRVAQLGPSLVQSEVAPDNAAEAARALASPDAADRLGTIAAAELQAFRQAIPEGAWFYQGTLASRSSVLDSRATVDLWVVQVWGGYEVPPSIDWVTLTVELTLGHDGWRQIGERTTPGPEPTDTGLGQALDGFIVVGGDDGPRP